MVSARGKLWMQLAVLLAVLGLAVSVYATRHHLMLKAQGVTDAACNVNDALSCDAVANSAYSEIQGIPLGVFGIGYFVALAVLATIVLIGHRTWREHMQGYVALVGIGVLTSIALFVISVTKINVACPTCIAIYTLTLLQGGLFFAFRSELPGKLDFKQIGSGATTAAIAVAAVVAVFQFARPALTPPAKELDAPAKLDPNTPALAAKVQDIPISRSQFAGLGEDYRRGPDDAKVVIVEFADFQCPACGQVKSVLDALAAEYPDKVQIVFRNFPLDATCNRTIKGKFHDFACKAAVTARCAGQYGKFWEMTNIIFDRQKSITEGNIKTWAKEVGLTDEQINTCWESQDILAKIKDDVELGAKLEIDSTPTLFINGRKVTGGRSLQELRVDVEQLLN